jgi:threonine synthase
VRFRYVCSECGLSYEISPQILVCPECSKSQEVEKPLRGILEVQPEGPYGRTGDTFDYLPVERQFFPPIPVGNTPLWQPVNLRERTGFHRLYIKDDTLNPTGSLKDRASYLVAAFARQHGIRHIVVASTGNAASSMAGVGAAGDLKVTIFIPKTAPPAKMIQALQYGAEVVAVDGSYDEAYDLSLEYSQSRSDRKSSSYRGSILSRNTGYNPLTIEGKKTVSFEIYAQVKGPVDYLFVPAGDGVILSGVYKGFRDLLKLGKIKRVPTIYAVQAEGSSALYTAFLSGDFTEPPVQSSTLADSIAVNVPRAGYYALKQLKTYEGRCVTVSDSQIIEAQRTLASTTGLFAEPAASAALAGFLKVRGELLRTATVVLLVTGNGLKDVESAMRGVKNPCL